MGYGRKQLALSVASCFVLLVSGVKDMGASNDGERLPIRLISNYVVVQGSLAGRANCTLVIDTGVNPSILHSRTAQDLKLVTTPQTVRMLDREVQTSITQLPSFALGPLQRGSTPMLVHDLSQMERNLGIRIDALVGLDLLGQTDFTVDYISRYMSFGKVEKTASSAKLVALQPGAIIEAKVEGKTVRLLVDTGSPGLVLFFDPQSGKPGVKATNVTEIADGRRKGEVLVKQTRVGNVELAPGKAFLETGGQGGGVDGLLGMTPLHPRSIALDFQHGRFYWKSYDAPTSETRPRVSAADECYAFTGRSALANTGKSPAVAGADVGQCREEFRGVQYLNK